MKCLVTGAHGQLGRAVVEEASRRGQPAVGLTRAQMTVEDAETVHRCLQEHRPDVVLHCGAMTNVDGCEREPERALAVNGEGTANVARACAEIGARLVYVSTDFVFDGAKNSPYLVDDAPSPTSAYGRSKLRGEQAVLEFDNAGWYVVRTGWVFGPSGANFPKAILKRARAGHALRVVDDQVGSPTMTRDLAEALLDLAGSGAVAGIYHASNSGVCSWHEFAVQILECAGMEGVEVATMTSGELDRPAPRPSYSVLDGSRLAAVRGAELPHYLDALKRYLSEELS